MSPSPAKPRRWHLAAVLIADVRLGRLMLLGGCLCGLLSLFGISLFPCPWRAATGLPCPGCGMTRSALSLLRGDLAGSLRENALTWVILLFWLVVAIGLAVPAKYRTEMAERIGEWEQRTRWPLWFGILLVAYTLTRWAGIL
ncbi:MAG: DUF2752 domain-containing protein [Akkermansiaceae bacterium]|nr:DUF2752 domain-containing protein [Akkermansiaceae bacterium]MCF7733695.1 DUF2752 domain-containing protein [Akkermansiaceae bacterium]